MIQKSRILVTDAHDPHVNLATEEALLRANPQDTATLFLWQNAHTVVIGAGQNAWSECRVRLLEQEKGTLARRSSGGGAVYHDLGNLNFSFVLPRAAYDVARQLRVVLRAVNALGIPAEATGRNDLTIDGRKFSGNAFRLLRDTALHHGTLLVRSDMEMVARYLQVDPDKLKAKGVKSVRSRVVNLADCADVSVDAVAKALMRAFQDEYGDCGVGLATEADLPEYAALLAKYRSWEWNYGQSPAGDLCLRKRFAWGAIEFVLTIAHGRVAAVAMFTDSMDETLKPRAERALLGCAWQKEKLFQALDAIGEEELARFVAESV